MVPTMRVRVTPLLTLEARQMSAGEITLLLGGYAAWQWTKSNHRDLYRGARYLLRKARKRGRRR